MLTHEQYVQRSITIRLVIKSVAATFCVWYGVNVIHDAIITAAAFSSQRQANTCASPSPQAYPQIVRPPANSRWM